MVSKICKRYILARRSLRYSSHGALMMAAGKLFARVNQI